jgi:hypothetical protein
MEPSLHSSQFAETGGSNGLSKRTLFFVRLLKINLVDTPFGDSKDIRMVGIQFDSPLSDPPSQLLGRAPRTGAVWMLVCTL